MGAGSDLCPDLLRMFGASADPIVVVDDRWVVVYWNRAAEEAFGRLSTEVVGRNCYDIVAGVDGEGRQVCRMRCEKWALARRGGRVRHFSVKALPSTDTWVDVTVLPILDQANRPIALAHVLRNIERTKRLERFVRGLASSAEDVLTAQAKNGNGNASGNGNGDTPVHLTPRELEVLTLLSRGAGTAAISEKLGVSGHTVHNHIATTLNKLGVHSRAEAVAYAFEHRLVDR
ncbi:MAG TPA: LuxR C-terminal-related transcriptional regulator [Candidatus Limnocylindria bacterium]|nr:LuxR C-terminal-related transcriptional regulator [Candidatus Limnocylindria bacterium]